MSAKLFFVITFCTVLILFYPSLNTYFSQDDFFHFKLSQTDNNFQSIVNFFGFHPFSERGVAFYRPLFREFLYHSYYNLFGLNHIPFRILSFTLQFINITLVYCLIKKVFKNKLITYLTTFMFAISSANTAILYYLAGGIQAQGATMLMLLSIISYLKYQEKSKILFLASSFTTFILSLMSHELASVTPVLLVGLILIYSKNKRRDLMGLGVFYIVLAIYLYLNITIIGFSRSEQQYQVALNPKSVVNSYMWYIGWAFGLPEMLIDFVNPGFKVNPNLMLYWKNNYWFIFPSFIASLLSLLITLVLIIKMKIQLLLDKRFIFMCFWFAVGLAPVILLPSHKSNYYLATSLPAFWGSISFLIISSYQLLKRKTWLSRLHIFIPIASLTILSASSIYLGRSTFWAATRGELAKSLLNQIKYAYPKLPKAATLFIKDDPKYPNISQEWGSSSKQASFILNGSDAIQLLYNDPTIRVVYQFNENTSTPYPLMLKIYP